MLKATEPLGNSPAAYTLGRAIAKAAPTAANVLIVGEHGTGKELVARAIHDRSSRSAAPFVVVDCGAISSTLAETEFLGHEQDDDAGQTQITAGYFESSNGGTLFLDEVTEMPPAMQVQLLRSLESGRYQRVGGSSMRNIDIRVIATTNRDPYDAIARGTLRSDLFYRLAVFPLKVPPLRDRIPDIEYLAHRFLGELNTQEGTQKSFSPQTVAQLESYHWPSNVRELKDTVISAFILADDLVHIQAPDARAQGSDASGEDALLKITIGTPLTDAQQAVIMATLNHYSGDKRRAAKALGISPKTLYNRLERFQKDSQPINA